MSGGEIVVHAARKLPPDLAVLCGDCASPVPLAMFVDEGWAKRQVRCPGCACDVVLRDAW